MTSKIENRTRVFEIAAVILTGIGKFVLMDLLQMRFVYISAACLFWGGYMIYQANRNKGIIAYWGLSLRNFNKTFLELLPVAILFVGIFVLVGNQLGTNILSWNIIPILLLYPIWGIIQQFIVIGLLAKNLTDLEKPRMPESLIVFITALIFSIVHYPHFLLIIGTFFLALVYTKLYLKERNLIVLGIFHGWLGAFFFYTILERDPWNEVFGMIFQ
jgi:hypothetical protein